VFGYPNWALKWWEKKRVKYEGERERERRVLSAMQSSFDPNENN